MSQSQHIDHEKFSALVHRLYNVVSDLQEMFPGRHFSFDGHMVGSQNRFEPAVEVTGGS